MSISYAMQTGVSGLRANSTAVGRISENIANANTDGYRRSFVQMVSNPSIAQTERFILEGQRATWPKLAMIKHQTRISRTFEQCLQTLRGGSVQDVDQSLRKSQLETGALTG